MIAGDGAAAAASVRQGTRAVLRTLMEAPAAVTSLQALVEPSPAATAFLDVFGHAREFFRSRLETTADTKKAQLEYEQNLQARIAEAQKRREALRDKLRGSRQGREQDSTSLTDQISKMSTEIEDVKARGLSSNVALQSYTDAQEGQLRTAHDNRVRAARPLFVRPVQDARRRLHGVSLTRRRAFAARTPPRACRWQSSGRSWHSCTASLLDRWKRMRAWRPTCGSDATTCEPMWQRA